jgi:hypothetical protein
MDGCDLGVLPAQWSRVLLYQYSDSVAASLYCEPALWPFRLRSAFGLTALDGVQAGAQHPLRLLRKHWHQGALDKVLNHD